MNILVFDLRVQLQHCTYQRKTLLFALIKVSTFICKREILDCSSPLSYLSLLHPCMFCHSVDVITCSKDCNETLVLKMFKLFCVMVPFKAAGQLYFSLEFDFHL